MTIKLTIHGTFVLCIQWQSMDRYVTPKILLFYHCLLSRELFSYILIRQCNRKIVPEGKDNNRFST